MKGKENMSLFLDDIRSEEYMTSLSESELTVIERYLEQMQTGPADGQMDIAWQEQGYGYYAHLHELECLSDPDEKAAYRKRLEADIETWLTEKPGHYMVENVRKWLSE